MESSITNVVLVLLGLKVLLPKIHHIHQSIKKGFFIKGGDIR